MRSQVRARATFLKPGRCHPLLALFVMATFLLSLAPRRVRAEDPKQVVEIPKEQIETPAPEQPATVPEQQVMSLPTGENKSGVTSQAISVSKGPGTIQGMGESFSAQPSTGIATFSVPFALPKARGAVQPSLSLGYSSSSGSGIAGIGWDAYDASDARVRKTVVAPDEDTRHTLYVFNSLELRLAEYLGGQYTLNASTEVPYLFAHGVRLARVVHTAAPDSTSPSTRVYLELGDQLGSTSVVLDRATGGLVQRSTAYAYGGAESSYRPGRWENFREDYRFTGKEDDIEVGLIYFGARYLNPQLGRWMSADPLGAHSPGKADLNLYAYVHGRVLVAVDPVGLDGDKSAQAGLTRADGEQPAKPGEAVSWGRYGDFEVKAQVGGRLPSDTFFDRMAGATVFHYGAFGGPARFVGENILMGPAAGFVRAYEVIKWVASGGIQEAVDQLGKDLAEGPTAENGRRMGETIGAPLVTGVLGGAALERVPQVNGDMLSWEPTHEPALTQHSPRIPASNGVPGTGRGAASLPEIGGTQVGLGSSSRVDAIKSDMARGAYEYSAPRGRIAGIVDSEG